MNPIKGQKPTITVGPLGCKAINLQGLRLTPAVLNRRSPQFLPALQIHLKP